MLMETNTNILLATTPIDVLLRWL